MIVYATHSGGRYLPIKDSLREQPEGKRGVYVNLTNQCNCACTFCLRHMKGMAEESRQTRPDKMATMSIPGTLNIMARA